jgi:hypothetical protein
MVNTPEFLYVGREWSHVAGLGGWPWGPGDFRPTPPLPQKNNRVILRMMDAPPPSACHGLGSSPPQFATLTAAPAGPGCWTGDLVARLEARTCARK